MPSRIIRRSRAAVLLAIAAGAAPLAAQPRTPPVAALDSIVAANLARDHTVGAVVGVVRGEDTLLLAAYGKSNVERNVPMRTDAVFGIGSITKQFTAAAILQLHDQGTLDLDDDLARWLPGFGTRGAGLTLRRLLDHTSGMADVGAMPELAPRRVDPNASRDSLYAVMERYPLRFAPGAAQAYSSAGYWLLHLVIEKASGLAYPQYLERMIFTPLGMTSTGICHGEPDFARRATGYGVRGGESRRAPENAPAFYLGSGVLCSSVADMLTWLQALHGGRVLSPESYARMVAPSALADGTPLRYGLGVDVREDAHGIPFIGHSGELPGYAARANWYPDARMAVVVLMNNSLDSSPTALVDALAGRILPETPPAVGPFAGDAGALVGTYSAATPAGPGTIQVSSGPEGLMVSVGGAAAQPLSWVEGLTFRQGGVLVTFRGAGGGNGPATELRYDTGTQHSIFTRS